MLPPGAFITLRLLIAGHNWLSSRASPRIQPGASGEAAPAAA
jgi:hypothetical protein